MEMPPEKCPHCGATRSPALEGMCPGCLMDTVLGPPPSFPEARFGDYELVQEIAQGGMGVVYRARQSSLERPVALKMLTGGALPSEAEIRRIHGEAKIAASLKHPNIVPIYEVGVHEEIAYFTMPWMEGGSLAEHMPRFHGRFREAAQLLETISRGVHHGHQRGILHRDLKPANVLLDAAGIPYVADFGLARELDAEAQTASVEGTLSYMPLEQAQPGDAPLTVAVDVYSLGVILYELLTGRLPFEAESFDALIARLREGMPRAPRAIAPRIPRSLDAVCLKCLEKEPARRYGSAAELADDLRRFLENRPVLARSAGPLDRSWMWCLRHPLGAGLLATLTWALSVAGVGAVRTMHKQEEMLAEHVVQRNVFDAPVMAEWMYYRLQELGVRVKNMAADGALVAALQEGLQERKEKALEKFCRENYDAQKGDGAPFARVFVEDAAGVTQGRWPEPEPHDVDFLHMSLAFRDYDLGAKRMFPESGYYLSRAFQSVSHQRLMFAISAPVYSAGPERKLLGVVAAGVVSNSTLSSFPHEPDASNHAITLVSLVDKPPPDQYGVIVHVKMAHEMKAIYLDDKLGEQIRGAPSKSPQPGSRELKNYLDPVTGEPELAAFAPVRDTPYVVIVQTQRREALAASKLMAESISWWIMPSALVPVLVWLVILGVRSRPSARRASL